MAPFPRFGGAKQYTPARFSDPAPGNRMHCQMSNVLRRQYCLQIFPAHASLGQVWRPALVKRVIFHKTQGHSKLTIFEKSKEKSIKL